MNIYSFTCTRSKDFSETTKNLFSYLSRARVKVKVFPAQNSIFKAYSNGLKMEEIEDEDIIIMCHDDIHILTDPKVFIDIIVRSVNQYKTGFIGVAGTTYLSENAIWWDQTVWKQGLHRGYVYHGNDLLSAQATYYGVPGQVVCLDGLFLAAKAGFLRKLRLDKPKEFPGEWDFYDIHSTIKANKLGYINKVVPISIMHESHGELAGRESWHQNRAAFISMNKLPITCPC